QGYRLCCVARVVFATQYNGAARNGVFDAAHDESFLQFAGPAVAEFDDFGEVMAGVDVHQGEREASGAEGFFGQAQQYDGIFAVREQQYGAFALGGHFAHDVDCLRFEPVEVAAYGGSGFEHGHVSLLTIRGFSASMGWAWLGSPGGTKRNVATLPACRPHSLELADSHHQRPARSSSPARTARVQG